MPSKKIVQDIIPNNRKSIKSNGIHSLNTRKIVDKSDEDTDFEEVKIKTRKNNKTKFTLALNDKFEKTEKRKFPSVSSKIITFLIIFISIAIIAIALSLLYTKAIVTINTTSIPINVDGNFIASKDSVKPDALTYQTIAINLDEYKSVPATDGPLIQTKAKGTITIYNNFSTTSQKLLAGTKILANNQNYKTTWSVVVPGRKTVSGKIVAGAVDVGIIAENAGSEFNLSLNDKIGDFNILSYKGTPKYATIIGKIKKEITGGYSGKNKIISLEVEKAGYQDLEKTLKEKLIKNVMLTIPEGLVLFDNAYTIDYTKLPQSSENGNTAKIGMKGVLNAVIFNSNSLTENIAKKQINDKHLKDYKTEGIKNLNYSLINAKDQPIKKEAPISFNLKGPIRIVGIFSESELKDKLIGVKLEQTGSIVKQYPSISNISVRITPFWMRSFPNSKDNIMIEYK